MHRFEGIEKGLTLVGRQVIIDVGRIDILAQDAKGRRVVIEVKVGEAKDSAVGQIARYLGWYSRADGQPARGILIAAEFPQGVRYAATAIPNLHSLRIGCSLRSNRRRSERGYFMDYTQLKDRHRAERVSGTRT